MVKIENIIKDFVNGYQAGSNARNLKFYPISNMRTVLVSYQTPIAIKFKDGIILNIDYYSNTTTRQQNLIERFAKENNIKVEKVKGREILDKIGLSENGLIADALLGMI